MGNNSSVKVGTENLISNVYNPISKTLTNATYGNGNKVNYIYDSLDRLAIKKLESRIYGYQVNVIQDPVTTPEPEPTDPGTGGNTGTGGSAGTGGSTGTGGNTVTDPSTGSGGIKNPIIVDPVKPPVTEMSITINDDVEVNSETDAATINNYSVYSKDNSKYEDKNYSAVYSYDNAGNLSRLSDGRNGDTHKYIYDLSNRLSKVEDSRGNWFQYNYDATNKLSTAASFIGGRNYSTTYSYDKDGKTKNITLPLGKNVEYIYDGLGRTINKDLKASGISIYKQTYAYISGANGSTTNLIASLTNNYNSGSRAINYSYDKLGRINEINDSSKGKNKYYYDELGQLTREDNSALNKTIVYTYDKGGNILSKENYNYTNTTALGTQISKINYQYSDSNWKDKLTSYNGKGITYDAIGNLSTYNNDVYRWEAGRSLKYINGTGKNIEYIYNIDGIRTGKKVKGVEYKYTLECSRVVCEEIYESGNTPTKTLVYNYGDNGLVGFTFNNTEYFYSRNAQSDIIGILDSAGNVVVEYTYDSWGQVISIEGELKDTLGVINPYRYRGYRYDNETGLYYLQSRYYNPEWIL